MNTVSHQKPGAKPNTVTATYTITKPASRSKAQERNRQECDRLDELFAGWTPECPKKSK